jgi:ATP-dependent DNA helicase RecQ
MSIFQGGLPRARALLRRHFGHPVLRVHQLKVLGALFAGRSVLAVLPTGAGKSLCYQLPALMADGLTLVISPLVALMQDQVAALWRRGLPAAYLNSLLTADDHRAVLAAACAGQVRMLYCAPERLAALVPRLRAHGVRVSFLAVDEAHCVIQWGNEFRPVYHRLGQYRYLLGDPITLAVTGSATLDTRADIVRMLRVPHADVILTSFDRPNLTFLVQRVRDDRERFARVRQLVRHAAGHTVLYTPTRRLTELVARALLRAGIAAAPYHAGLLPESRRQLLVDFLQDRVPIVVATSAFGMGIDKPDVRRVIQWGPPRTLEAYYQEAGRAGRDGARAECTILSTSSDFTWGECDPAVRRYVEGRGCRRRMLLEYFGETGVRCAGCDRCGAGGAGTGAGGANRANICGGGAPPPVRPARGARTRLPQLT